MPAGSRRWICDLCTDAGSVVSRHLKSGSRRGQLLGEMRRKLEELIMGGRWRRDEHAWRVWQGLAPMLPGELPYPWEIKLMTGRVVRNYQPARRGTKAVMDFGAAVGMQDTWWPRMRPPVGTWVVIRARLWEPPGTHSEQNVLWVESWESWAPGDVWTRASRHEKRLEYERRRREALERHQLEPPAAA